jgi:hypothetical protein
MKGVDNEGFHSDLTCDSTQQKAVSSCIFRYSGQFKYSESASTKLEETFHGCFVTKFNTPQTVIFSCQLPVFFSFLVTVQLRDFKHSLEK